MTQRERAVEILLHAIGQHLLRQDHYIPRDVVEAFYDVQRLSPAHCGACGVETDPDHIGDSIVMD